MAYKWAIVSIYHLKDDGLGGKKLVVEHENVIVDEQRDYWNEALSGGREEKYHYFEIVTGMRFTNWFINDTKLEHYVMDLIPINYLTHNEIKMKLALEVFGSVIKMSGLENIRPLKDATLEEVNDYYRNFKESKIFKCLQDFDEKQAEKNVKRIRKSLKRVVK